MCDIAGCLGDEPTETEVSLLASMNFEIQTVSIELDDVECRGLSISGEEKRLLEGLSLLMQRHSKLGIRLFCTGLGQWTWLQRLVVV